MARRGAKQGTPNWLKWVIISLLITLVLSVFLGPKAFILFALLPIGFSGFFGGGKGKDGGDSPPPPGESTPTGRR